MRASLEINGLKQRLFAFWNERNERERLLLTIAMIVMAAGLLYGLFIEPTLSGRRDLEKKLPALRQQAAELQVLAKDAAAAVDKIAVPIPVPTKERIEASLVDKGIKAQSIVLAGGLAKVQLASVSFAGMIEWLNEMQRTVRLAVVDARIDALSQTDMVNAMITLQQQKGE